MPLVKIDLKVAGEKQISRAFEASAREAEDMSEPLQRFGDHLLQQVGAQFASEGAQGGAPWPQLNAAYAAWKDEHYPGRPILVRTGALRAAATSKDAVTVTPRRLTYEIDGIDVHENPSGYAEVEFIGDVAVWHQKGRGHLPVRKIVDLNELARRQLDRYFSDWVNGLRRGQGVIPR